MKQRLLLFITLFPSVLFAQQKVIFPDDFDMNLNGKEVTITNPLIITDIRQLNTKGTLILAAERIQSATEENEPGKEMYAQWQNEYPKRILSLKADKTVFYRTGQQTVNLTGTVSVSNGTYTITPGTLPAFTGNERTTHPKDINTPYNLKIASFNLNYYISNPTLWNSQYGAANEAEFTRQRTKILTALKAMDADIYALCEVGEGQTAVQDIVQGLNDIAGTDKYSYIDNGDSKESTYTKNVFVYNTNKIEPYKNLLTAGSYLKLRHIIQAFILKENNEKLIISLNHFKSKSTGSGSDADQHDGQGNSNNQRMSEAYTLINELNNTIAYYEDPDVLILGDLNSYSKEDPIRILTNASLVNLLEYFSPQDYSYVYNGAIGYLDHSIATASMSKQVIDAFPWHINADEQEKFNYKYAANYSPDPYRCSDHDPIITTLMLEQATGIYNPDIGYKDVVQIFGNPRDGYLTLKSEYMNKIEVLNINGQIVRTNVPSATGSYFILPTEGLISGFYLLRVYHKEHYTTHKIIIP
ncbi:ExeM/NucH family extracellular endonuclease [Bacteroides sp.]